MIGLLWLNGLGYSRLVLLLIGGAIELPYVGSVSEQSERQ
jgi:hypothetical protein